MLLELARPVYGIEEANDDIAAHSFFNILQARSATKELRKSVVKMLVEDKILEQT